MLSLKDGWIYELESCVMSFFICQFTLDECMICCDYGMYVCCFHVFASWFWPCFFFFAQKNSTMYVCCLGCMVIVCISHGLLFVLLVLDVAWYAYVTYVDDTFLQGYQYMVMMMMEWGCLGVWRWWVVWAPLKACRSFLFQFLFCKIVLCKMKCKNYIFCIIPFLSYCKTQIKERLNQRKIKDNNAIDLNESKSKSKLWLWLFFKWKLNNDAICIWKS